MAMSRLPITFLLLCSMAASAVAAEYFVATNGRDEADGTAATRAFATVQKGASMLKAGDSLTILPGEYHESVEMRKIAGTKEAPITIRAQRPGTVLLRGDVEVEGWQAVANQDGVYSVNFTRPVQG